MGNAVATSAGFPSGDPYKGRPLGRVLTKQGKLTRDQVFLALTWQKELRSRGRNALFGEVLLELGLCNPSDIELAFKLQERGEPKTDH